MIVRRPYAEAAPSVYDYPLSSRFDETDALVVFDRVFVPWERVFVYRDIALTQAQFYETPAHVLGNHQAQVRFASKAQFLAGVALRIAESIGVDKAPQTRTMLGELASYCAMASGLVLASEAECVHDARGFVYWPDLSLREQLARGHLLSDVLTYVREAAGGGLLHASRTRTISTGDRRRPQAPRPLAGSSRWSGQLYNLAWDLVGSEFAGRHQQYEALLRGGPGANGAVRVPPHLRLRRGAIAMVARCLAGYDLPADNSPGP
jgi:4-hydroxyphenylacetate 3-monooxygenase